MLRPEAGGLGAAYELLHGALRGVQSTVVAQVFAPAAAVVVQPAHVGPGGVDVGQAECQAASGRHARRVDVGDVHHAVGIFLQQLQVGFRQSFRLAVEPYGGIAVAQGADGIGASADQQQHVELLLAMLRKQPAHQRQAVEVLLRLLSADQEAVTLVGVLRFVHLVERLLAALRVGIVALLGKDGVRRCGAANDDLVARGDGHLRHALPAVGLQMFHLDGIAPAAEVSALQRVGQRDARWLPHLVGTGGAYLNDGLVCRDADRLLHTIVLGQLLQCHAELVLTVATVPQVEVDGREQTAAFAHAVVLHVPVGTLLVGRIEMGRRRALVGAQAEGLLLVNHFVVNLCQQVADNVQTVVRGVVDSL